MFLLLASSDMGSLGSPERGPEFKAAAGLRNEPKYVEESQNLVKP